MTETMRWTNSGKQIRRWPRFVINFVAVATASFTRIGMRIVCALYNAVHLAGN